MVSFATAPVTVNGLTLMEVEPEGFGSLLSSGHLSM